MTPEPDNSSWHSTQTSALSALKNEVCVRQRNHLCLRQILFLSLCLLFWTCSEAGVVQHTITGRTMGTSFSVKVVTAKDIAFPSKEVETEINRLLIEINQQMSTYIDDSDISRFNKYDKSNWVEITEDLARVLDAALMLSRLSDGAFDITVGPLVNLWGFGPDQRSRALPSDAEIATSKALTGYQKLELRESDPPAVRKTEPGVYCDLSAIAKGFGVDKVAEMLESRGVKNYMVEIGGEVRTSGKNKEGVNWRIGVERPDTGSDLQAVIAISERAMATSGDYFNYFEVDGVRYSHTIDPRTGRPITHKLASVTVIHESCMFADGLATTIDVLGPEQGFEFARQRELPVFMIVREGEGFVERMTPQFSQFLHEETLGIVKESE